MRKAVVAGLGTAVVLVAAYAGATLWSGRVTQARHGEMIAKVQAVLPMLRLSAKSYDKGFFSARSTATFEIGCEAAGGKPPVTLVVIDTIRHGPFAAGEVAAAVIDSRVALGGEEGDRLSALFAAAPLAVHTVVGFTGHFTSTLRGSAAKMPIGEGAELTWQGLDGTFSSRIGASTFSYELKSPGMTLTDAARSTTVTLVGLAVRAAGEPAVGAPLVSIGTGSGSAESVEMAVALPAAASAVATPMAVSFKGLAYGTETTIAADLLTFRSTFGGSAVVNGAAIDRFDLKASMKRLHAPTYQRLMGAVSGGQAACAAAGRGANPALVTDPLQADVRILLQHDPEFALDQLTVDHAGRRGELSYSVGVQGVTPAEAQEPLLALLIKHLQIKASARVPVAWIPPPAQAGSSSAPAHEVARLMFDQAAAQGYLVREGDHVRSDLVFSDGTLKVNGEVVPLGGVGAESAFVPPRAASQPTR